MSSPHPPENGESAAQQIEQLLARSMGPMAKIVLARARKKGGDDQSLLESVAKYITHDAERAAFLAAAARVMAAQQKNGAAATLAMPREGLPQDAAESAAAPVESLARTAESITEIRPAPRDDGAMKPGAIFVSYTRDNLGVAQRLADALRGAGLDVWLDLGQLQAGDAWDLKIRRNIEACSFFMPLISRETEARREGYFRREWNIAADRALNFADDVPFLLPVTIDDTAAYTARVPERFRGAHWTALPGGAVTDELVDRMKALVDEYHRRHPSA